MLSAQLRKALRGFTFDRDEDFSSQLFAERKTAPAEDDDDSVQRDRSALFAQVPHPGEIAIGDVARNCKKRYFARCSSDPLAFAGSVQSTGAPFD